MSALVAACSFAPTYHVPQSAPAPEQYKEEYGDHAGWKARSPWIRSRGALGGRYSTIRSSMTWKAGSRIPICPCKPLLPACSRPAPNIASRARICSPRST